MNELFLYCGSAFLLGVVVSALLCRYKYHASQLVEKASLVNEHMQEIISLRETISRTQTELAAERQTAVEKLGLLEQSKQQLSLAFSDIANRLFDDKSTKLVQQNKHEMTNLLQPLREQLTSFTQQVNQAYDKETRERLSLGQEIRHLAELNKQMSEETTNLTRALKGQHKTQGAWGELILTRVLEHSGLEAGREYATQVQLQHEEGASFRPDVIIYLPDNKSIIIDAKVSLNAYERYVNCQNEDEQQQELQLHIAAVRQHIKSLSIKEYQKLSSLHTLDFVILFMPIEAAFSVAVAYDQQLLADALARNIILVTPTTLLATLRIIENLWRVDSQNKNAQKIAERAGRLHDKFVALVDDLTRLGQQLSTTQNTYDDIFNKLSTGKGNLVTRTQELKKLGAKTSKQLPAALVEMEEEVVEE